MKKILIKSSVLSLALCLVGPFIYADNFKPVEEPQSIEVLKETIEVSNEAKGISKEATPSAEAQVQPKSPSKISPLMDRELKKTSGDGSVTLAQLIKDKKAVLLDFYASWCGPCMKNMPALENKVKVLEPQGVSVVGINVDSRDITEAEKLRKSKSFAANSWLIESPEKIYSKHFAIKGIPTMVLLSQEGDILFQGHPDNAELKEALTKLGVSL